MRVSLILVCVVPLLAGAIRPFKASSKASKEMAKLNADAMSAAGNPSFVRPKCPPKLSKAAMIQKSWKARSLSAAKLPDPACHTGVVSLAGEGPETQVCCPAYCGECTDYPTCSSVKGQDSKYACCASDVFSRSCEHSDTSVLECVKSCTERTPPCIMPKGETFEMPGQSSAAEDCNNAVLDWMDSAKGAIVDQEGGKAQWKKQMTYKLK